MADDFTPGEMEIDEQEKTWQSFMGSVKVGIVLTSILAFVATLLVYLSHYS